jgi:N-acetylglucosaminyl-diphospho-decaprenol L-rhamnosyltransferase
VSSDLAIVVVTYNSSHVITAMLDSIPAALGGLSADVVVVDNGSTDDTLEVLAGRSDCRVVRSTNRGYSAGINLGISQSESTGPVLILNPDLTMGPDSVRPLMDVLRRPDTGISVPKVLGPDGQLQPSLRREPTLLRALGLTATKLPIFSEYVNQPATYLEPQVTDWALGAAMLISRDCMTELGEWDESFFLYSEETDYCLRARDHGILTRYTPASVVTHIGAQSGYSPKTHTMQIVNRVRLYHRRHGPVLAGAYLAATVLSELTWVARGHREQSWTAIKALLRPSLRPAELNCSDSFLPR